MNEFLDVLQAVLIAIVTVSVPILLKYGIALINTKIEEKTALIDNDYAKGLLKDVATILTTCVTEVTQTYVDDLKKTDSFTVENQKIAFEKAVEQAKVLLTDEAIDLLNEKYNDAEAYIRSAIEAIVKMNK